MARDAEVFASGSRVDGVGVWGVGVRNPLGRRLSLHEACHGARPVHIQASCQI